MVQNIIISNKKQAISELEIYNILGLLSHLDETLILDALRGLKEYGQYFNLLEKKTFFLTALRLDPWSIKPDTLIKIFDNIDNIFNIYVYDPSYTVVKTVAREALIEYRDLNVLEDFITTRREDSVAFIAFLLGIAASFPELYSRLIAFINA